MRPGKWDAFSMMNEWRQSVNAEMMKPNPDYSPAADGDKPASDRR